MVLVSQYRYYSNTWHSRIGTVDDDDDDDDDDDE